MWQLSLTLVLESGCSLGFLWEKELGILMQMITCSISHESMTVCLTEPYELQLRYAWLILGEKDTN